MSVTSTSHTPRVVVMGGSSGIGEATAELFADSGAEVVVTGRDQGKLDAAVARLGGTSSGYRLDATDAGQIAAFFEQSGAIDHLVIAVSGSAGSGPFAELDLDQLGRGFDGKFWPQVRIVKAALPHLDSNGSITLITAASAHAAFPSTAGLAAINGALNAMVAPLAVELAPLRVNAVAPGVINTEWWERVPEVQRRALFDGLAATTPVGRVGDPREVAAAVHLLATNAFVSGVVLDVTGGANLPTGR